MNVYIYILYMYIHIHIHAEFHISSQAPQLHSMLHYLIFRKTWLCVSRDACPNEPKEKKLADQEHASSN